MSIFFNFTMRLQQTGPELKLTEKLPWASRIGTLEGSRMYSASALARVYRNGLFGGCGALCGWACFNVYVDTSWPWWLKALVAGGLVGLALGFFTVAAEAILDRAWVRLFRQANVGVVLGGLGGALGTWFGEWINLAVQAIGIDRWRVLAAIVGRGLGWALLGAAIGVSVGLAHGVAARSSRKTWYGTVGGILGGLVGGLAFAGLLEWWHKEFTSYIWGQGIGLIVLGFCIGGFIALVEEVFKPAALKVVRGWQEGREFSLLRDVVVLGRAEMCDILLLRDMKIARQHARIERSGDRFFLVREQGQPEWTRVNARLVEDRVPIHPEERIEIGDTVLKLIVKKTGLAQAKD